MKKTLISPKGSPAVLALALASSCVYAQQENPSTPTAEVPETELAPVTISAHEGTAVPYDATGVSVSILDPEELKKEGIYSVTEALTTVPGTYVLPGGGSYQRGNISDLVIRGMSSQRYVLSMMDGMRLDGMNSDGLVTNGFISRAPMFGMGTMELLRGAEGAVYGSGAMSGVLFMETPEGKGTPSASRLRDAPVKPPTSSPPPTSTPTTTSSTPTAASPHSNTRRASSTGPRRCASITT